MPDVKRILIGQIGPAHGVRGDVLVHSYAAVPEDIASYAALTNQAGTRTFRIASLKHAGQRLVARLEGITDRNAAEALRGTELYIDRALLPAAAAGEWYHADLIGLTVVDDAGVTWGAVKDVANYGAGDLLEIAPSDGGDTELVPFTNDYVPAIDMAAARVVVFRPGSIGGDEREVDQLPEAQGA